MNSGRYLALLKGLSALPLGLLRGLGGIGGLLTFALSGRLRRKVRDSLRTAGLHSRRLAWINAAQMGQATLESAWIWCRPGSQLLARSDASAIEAIVQRTPLGRILLTPHLGAWEAAGRLCAAQAPITVLFKPPRQPFLRDVVRQVRTHADMTPAPADASGVRMLMKALRRRESIGILPDQVPTDGEGEWVPFFGRPAFTMVLPARIAERTGLPVFVCVAWRRRGGWVMEAEQISQGMPQPVERPHRTDAQLQDAQSPPEPPADVLLQTPLPQTPLPEQINAAIERLILRNPQQYLWSYNRYKLPGKGA